MGAALCARMHNHLFKLLLLAFTVDLLAVKMFHGRQWITICGSFSDKLTEELVVGEMDGVNLVMLSTDSILCLKIGLYQAEVSISSTSYFVLIGIDGPGAFHVCIYLIAAAICCLVCNTVLFLIVYFIPMMPIRIQFHLKLLGLIFSVVSLILLSRAVVEFTTYRESTADIDPIAEPFKHMMNRFSASYGSSFFLLVLSVVCNGLMCVFIFFLFRQNKSTIRSVESTQSKLLNSSFV